MTNSCSTKLLAQVLAFYEQKRKSERKLQQQKTNILEEENFSELQNSPRILAQFLRVRFDENIATLLQLSKKYSCIQNSPAFDLKADCPLWHFRSRDSKPTILSKSNMGTYVESEVVGGPESASTSETESDGSKCSPCACMSLDKHEEARGVNFNGIGRGAISMSNVYLSNSLILLACIQAGGADPNNMRCIDQTVRVYGFRPASLISNIYAGAGLVAAFLMPVIGAMIDFSPHRKKIGVIMAVLLALVSGIQIGTVEVRSDYSFLFLMVYFYAMWSLPNLFLSSFLGYLVRNGSTTSFHPCRLPIRAHGSLRILSRNRKLNLCSHASIEFQGRNLCRSSLLFKLHLYLYLL